MAEKEIVKAYTSDFYDKINYSYKRLDSSEFNDLIFLLLDKYDTDIYLISNIGVFLHEKNIYDYDSILISRCQYFESLPNNYSWDVYFEGSVIRQYKTGEINNGFENTICKDFN